MKGYHFFIMIDYDSKSTLLNFKKSSQRKMLAATFMFLTRPFLRYCVH